MCDPESRELRAFGKFCEIRELQVQEYETRPPPEPDVLAVVHGQTLAYELTEAVEPKYARKLSDLYRTPQLVRDCYGELPDEVKREIEALHHGKMIDPCFTESVSLRNRRKALPVVFEFLLTLPREFGSEQLDRIERPLEALDHIAMRQVGWDGISWQPGAPAGWIDPEAAVRYRLMDKMTNKTYETKQPIELIVYLDREIAPSPGTGWQDALAEVASQHLAESPFSAVWLMDLWTESVAQLAAQS